MPILVMDQGKRSLYHMAIFTFWTMANFIVFQPWKILLLFSHAKFTFIWHGKFTSIAMAILL